MYTVLDIEASGLGVGSYPIEIGIAFPDGRSECTLIVPTVDWTHWDKNAEALHGISRESLILNGRSPLTVALMLNELLQGEVVYSDAWGNDSVWLAKLFDAAGICCRFSLDSTVVLLDQQQLARWHTVKEAVTERMLIERHRASNDARIIQQTLVALNSASLDDALARAS